MKNPFRRKPAAQPDEYLRLEIKTSARGRQNQKVLLGGHDITKSLQGVEFKMGLDGVANVTLRAVAVTSDIEVKTRKVRVVQKTHVRSNPGDALPDFEVLLKREQES